MEQLLEAAAFFIQLWRMALCIAAAVVVSFVLKALFPGLPAGALFAFVFVAASVGITWHVGVLSARERSAGGREAKISKPIAFLGIALIGGLWGGLAESALGLTAAAFAILLVPWFLGPLFATISKRPVPVRSIAFATAAATVGFAAPHAIILLFQLAEA
jgi:hypothetical protein